MSMHSETIRELRERLSDARSEAYTTERRLIEQIVQLTEERDEARRERDHARRGLCYEIAAWVAGMKHSSHEAESQAEAERRGWDCFKEGNP